MKASKIAYFEKPGSINTSDLLDVVKNRITQGDISHIVVASSSGDTALKLIEELSHEINIIVVGLHAGFRGEDNLAMSPERVKEIEQHGAIVFIGSHSLSGVGRSISNKFGGVTQTEIIAHTLRTFCGDGLKVAVEISIMAADAGLVPTDKSIIAIGGTHGGADTAIVLKPAHMNNFFDTEIKEILAKPINAA